jgi:hypothetical protein
MPSEIYKILNNAAEYTCLACGTHNCNSGSCVRCGSVQYGSPDYLASGLARRDRLLSSLSPEQYAAHIADKQREARETEDKRIRERKEDERRQAADRKTEAARLAVTLPIRARWKQQKMDEQTAWLRHISKRVLIVLACVLFVVLAFLAIRLADFSAAASWSGLLGTLAAAGGYYARSRCTPEAPARPSIAGSSHSRAPRSE